MKAFITKLIKWRVTRYLISGGLAAAVNLILLFVLVHFFYVWYLLAAVLSYISGVYVSFMMQKFFTFSNYSREKIRQETTIYLIIQIFNLGTNTLFMYISVDILNIHYMISQVIIGGAIAIYSFFVYKHVVFRQSVYNKKDINGYEKNETVS
ncbi:MAG: GtrA family protein [Patescibacteria group bacterium]